MNRAAYGKERTIVSRRGKDLAAVIPIDDLHLLERLAREGMDRSADCCCRRRETAPFQPVNAGAREPPRSRAKVDSS